MKTSFLPSHNVLLAHTFGVMLCIVIAAALVACTLTRPSPVKRTYLLEPAAPAAAATSKPMILKVGAINVAAPFRGRQLVYRADELKYEADFYSEFFVAPAAMLAEATSRAIVAAKTFQRVIPPGAAPDEGDYLLDGFVNDFYGDARDPAKGEAVLSITYYLSALNPARGPTVIWSQEYRERVPMAGTNADAVVRAWNTGLTKILADLTRDLGALDLPPK